MLKRTFDVILSAVLLIVFSPLMLIIALANRWGSPGPVFYLTTRVGRGGRRFDVYKFRTMVVDADKCGPGITPAGDPRITPIGRFLRKRKLDELPQLINVLRGEMSLVGPRPEDPRYVERYTPEQLQILTVRPGITSPASVQFCDEEAMLCGQDWETYYIREILPTKLRIDLNYVRHANLWLDIVILYRTVLSIGNLKTRNQGVRRILFLPVIFAILPLACGLGLLMISVSS